MSDRELLELLERVERTLRELVARKPHQEVETRGEGGRASVASRPAIALPTTKNTAPRPCSARRSRLRRRHVAYPSDCERCRLERLADEIADRGARQ
jgi:hypothetical protein